MGEEALLPCLVCSRVLKNVCSQEDNQPYGGTEFRTYGHYGSTFWDSLDGEELVLNICDSCLRGRQDRLGQQKRFLSIRCDGRFGFGNQWVDRPLVAYTGNPDDGTTTVELEELRSNLPNVQWSPHIEELKRGLQMRDSAP